VAEQATERMVVAATPERCFEVSSDIAAYPQWASDIKEVTVDERDDQAAPGTCCHGHLPRAAYAGAACPAPTAIRFSAFMCAMAKVSSVICASL